MTFIHQCKENTEYYRIRPETRYSCREDKKGKWYLIFGVDEFFPVVIKRCPFCGAELIPPTEDNRED